MNGEHLDAALAEIEADAQRAAETTRTRGTDIRLMRLVVSIQTLRERVRDELP